MRNSRLVFLAECGMLLAAAMAFSQIRLFRMPQGGSVSLKDFPIMLFAARWGVVPGIACGAVMGFLILLTGPVVLSPLQFLLDYPLAYMFVGLAGIFEWSSWRNTTVAVSAAGVGRLVCHTLSGMIFFADERTVGAAFWFSLAYNASHVIPETILSIVVASNLTRVHKDLTRRQLR